jgi:hypothetical protein
MALIIDRIRYVDDPMCIHFRSLPAKNLEIETNRENLHNKPLTTGWHTSNEAGSCRVDALKSDFILNTTVRLHHETVCKSLIEGSSYGCMCVFCV